MTRLLVLVSFAACAEPEPQDVAEDPCLHSPMRWDSFAEPFFTVWCTSCHSSAAVGELRYGAPVGVDLDTYEGVAAWEDRVDARAVETTDMPLGGYGPPEEEREKLGEWLDCGLQR